MDCYKVLLGSLRITEFNLLWLGEQTTLRPVATYNKGRYICHMDK